VSKVLYPEAKAQDLLPDETVKNLMTNVSQANGRNDFYASCTNRKEMSLNHKRFTKSSTRLMVLLLVASMMALTGLSAGPAVGGYEQALAPVPYASEGKLESGDLEIFTDELITRQLAEYHIAGATVSIVQDGKIELAKGYGYADVEMETPVIPGETIFRIGSTSKLFTWTAVMQLAEQGKIDLSADVNAYLPDFQIPATYPDPITMLNLMSHTAGFEERTAGVESPSPGEMISLHDCLVSYMPDRVRPAGELISYSNYGTALAGYIVEAVSGMPFEQYVETYLFQPLSMVHSTFRQPIPPALEGQLAEAYSYSGEYVPGSFAYVNLTPAGAMSSTAHDMANFMIAHLQEGKFEGKQILQPETVGQMHRRLFSNDERLDGTAHGFFEWNFNGRRVLWHSGDIGNWHSGLAIIPEENVGFFVNYNSYEGIPAVVEFYYAFLNAFFPAQETGEGLPPESSAQAAEDLSGEYRTTRSIYNHVERIISFPGDGNVRVSVNPDRTLSIAGQAFYEKEPLVYSPQDGTDTLIFHQDGLEQNTHFHVNSNQLFSYERVLWYETSAFNLLAFRVCYGLLLTALLAALIEKFRGRQKNSSDSRMQGIARLWALVPAVVFLLVPAVTTIYSELDYKYPFPFYMVVLLAIILAASILVVGPIIFTFLAWARRYWGLAGRVHYTLIAAALVGMVWLMYYWRLLGFRY
jgi:CubicO group peptidase (beta-lactamase class C family)